MKRICSVIVALAFALLPLCFNASAADGDVILSFGDSITASGIWQKMLDERFGINIINMGVGGDNSEDGLKRLEAALSKKPDVVILMFGANDSARDMEKGRSLESFVSNMSAMIDAFQASGAKVICIKQSYYCAEDYYTRHDKSVFDEVGGIEAYMDAYIEAFGRLAEEKGCIVADVRSLCEAYSNRRDIIADGIHPNNNGYRLYAEAVGEALTALNRGDIDGDGRVNSRDYICLKLHILGKDEIDKFHLPFADIDCNGRIEAKDYVLLRLAIMGKYAIH